MKRSLLTGFLMATIGLPTPALSQGSVELTATNHLSGSKVRGKIAYGLPWEISGFSFAQVSGDADSYFAMNILERGVASRLGIQLQILSASGFRDSVGPGVSFRPPLGESARVSFNLVPFRVNTRGKLLVDRLDLGYFADYDFGGGWIVSAFGGMNLSWSDGLGWGYGETYVTRTLTDRWTVGAGADVISGDDDDPTEVNPGIIVRYTPR